MDLPDDQLTTYAFRLLQVAECPLVNGAAEKRNDLAAGYQNDLFTINAAAGQRIYIDIGSGPVFGSASQLAATTRLLKAAGQLEDGYSGLHEALTKLPFRPEAAVNLVLITDAHRSILDPSLTLGSILEEARTKNVHINVVLDGQVASEQDAPGIGLDSAATVYLSDGNGGFTIASNGHYVGAVDVIDAGQSLQHYVPLAWQRSGATWDLNRLRLGGNDALSFTKAFVDINAEAIDRQLDIDLLSSDPSASFANLTGLLKDVQPGQTANFNFTVHRGGPARSFSLLFFRPGTGALLGSIPTRYRDAYSYQVIATDPDGDPLQYSLLQGPQGATLDSQTGLLRWFPDSSQSPGFILSVADGRGGTASQDFTVNPQPPESNQNPVITSTPPTEAAIARAYAYTVQVTDAEGDTPSFYLTTAPVGMSIDRQSGLIQWSPIASQLGSRSVTVLVLDGRGGQATQSFDILVKTSLTNRSPLIGSLPPVNAVAGVLYRYQVVAADFDGDPLTFDSPLHPDGLTIHSTSGLVLWTPTAAQAGTQNVILRVQDGQGGVTLQDVQINVKGENTAPIITSKPHQPALANLPYQYQVQAQDAENDTLGFLLDVGPPGMALNSTSGLLTCVPDASQLGTHTVQIRVADVFGGIAKQTFTLSVVAATPNQQPAITSTPRQSIRLGNTYLYRIQASDQDGDPLTFSLLTAPSGMAFSNSQPSTFNSQLLEWVPSSDQFGANNVVIRVSDGRGGEATQSFTIDVISQPNNQPPTIISTPLLGATVGKIYAYDLVGADPDGDPLFWTLTTAPAGMSLDQVLGTLRWVPTTGQIGSHDVSIQVIDAQGGIATQTFGITVRPVNLPPSIASTPPTTAAVNALYKYALQATDPEAGPLTFSLSAAPAGMTINSSSGLVQWTPGSGQLGSHSVTIFVQDDVGAGAFQSYNLVIVPTENHSPVITSNPSLAAILGSEYTYQLTATDADNDTLMFALPTSPSGMSIDANTGLLRWTPTSAELGVHQVKVTATDPQGATAWQTFSITVYASNEPPTITSNPVRDAYAGSPYQYDVWASDPDSDPLSISLVAKPSGMTIDNLGRIKWTPASGDVGSHPVSIRVADIRSGVATQNYDLVVHPDALQPLVKLQVLPSTQVLPGTDVTFVVTATDNVGIQSLNLTLAGSPLVLDALGHATATATSLGQFPVIASATDAAGNTSSASADLLVIDPNPNNPNPPQVAITAPADDAAITHRIDVIGTVNDDNLLSYKLSFAPTSGGPFTQIATGNQPVINGVLGKFDPTLLENDSYILHLEATDAAGSTSIAETTVHVTGELKVGNFRLSFVDLSIPVSGIPITVARTYDTLQAGKSGDFGYGWRLEFRETRLRSNVKPTGLEDSFVFNPFWDGTKVFVTMPGGKRQRFTFHPIPFLWFYKPNFVPDAGVTDQLTVPDQLLVKSGGKFYEWSLGLPYNPADPDLAGTYQITTKDGITYNVNALSGQLSTVSDPNENALTFSDNGIFSAAGPKVLFHRDPQGRITSITDPMGHQILYQYDPKGDLVSVTDRENNTTTFVYLATATHYLHDIIDPLGNRGVRSEYDASGRLGRLLDAKDNATQLVHDLDNSVEQVVDALGNITTYVYDDRGNVVEEVDALGGVTSRTYDENNFMIAEVDPLGNTSKTTYDSAGNAISESDPVGHTTLLSYGPRSLPLTVTDPLGHTMVNVYDQRGNLLAATDAAGNTSQFTYDSVGNLISATDAAANTTHFEYDQGGHLLRRTDALGHTISYTYDATGHQLTASVTISTPSGPRNLTRLTTYDSNGRPTAITNPDGNKRGIEYDADGMRSALVDPIGRRTEFRYDDRGKMIAQILPDGSSNAATYDAVGRRISSTDAAGRTTHYEYDKLGRLLTTIFPNDTPGDLTDNPRTRTEYDLAGRVIAQVDERGNPTSFVYDSAGHSIALKNALGYVTSYSYDAAGRRIGETDPLGHTTQFVYDAAGRRTETQFADGTETTTAYDARGRAVAETDQAGATTTFQYDPLGRLTTVIDALGNVTSYTYDDAGNLTFQSDANGHTTRHEYDDLGHRISTILPLGQKSTATYDSVGNVTSITDFSGHTTRYEYDSNNRLVRKTFDPQLSSVNPRPVTYTYTPTGHRQTVTDDRGVTMFAYDARDRLIRRTDPNGRAVGYTYDAAGNRTSVITFTAQQQLVNQTLYTFDVLNRPATITDHSGGVTTYAYDAVNNVAHVQMPNGTGRANTYDALNRTTKVTHSGPTGIFANFEYSIGPSGNRTRVVENTGRTVQWTYDKLYRLTQEVMTEPTTGNRTIDYTFDAVGNRLTRVDSAQGTRAYSYDANDELLTEAFASIVNPDASVETIYAYDSNGNTISRINDAEAVQYTWNAEDRLAAAHITNSDGTTHNISFDYDDDGIRTASDVDGTRYEFLMDANRPYAEVLEESDAESTVNTSFTWGQSLISQTSVGGRSWYHADVLGSTRALTSQNGFLTDRYDFDAYGNITARSGATINRYQFAGQERDDLLNLDYLRARYLRYSLGRFYGRDPIEGGRRLPSTLNPFIYAIDNPVNNTDPSGAITFNELMTGVVIVGILATTTGVKLLSWINRGLPDGVGYGFLGNRQLFGKLGAVKVGGGLVAGVEWDFYPSFGKTAVTFWGGAEFAATVSPEELFRKVDSDFEVYEVWYWNIDKLKSGLGGFADVGPSGGGLSAGPEYEGLSPRPQALYIGASLGEPKRDWGVFLFGGPSFTVGPYWYPKGSMMLHVGVLESFFGAQVLRQTSIFGTAGKIAGFANLLISDIGVEWWVLHTYGRKGH